MTRITAEWLNGPSKQVCAMLTDAGYQAWFVGGCVRNALIDAPVSDLDISTDARPEAVMKIAKSLGLRVVPTGIEHGTVTVVVDGTPFEITTFRRDVATDGRRAVVAFADTMEEDARRRDFTMNALYCDIDGEVADPILRRGVFALLMMPISASKRITCAFCGFSDFMRGMVM